MRSECSQVLKAPEESIFPTPVFWQASSLATVGVVLTALAVGLFATAVLGFSLLNGMLLGAIVSSTDAAAVFSVLRSRNVSLRGRLKPLLELESGRNDPMAVFLTVGLIQMLSASQASPGTILQEGDTMLVLVNRNNLPQVRAILSE